MMRCRYIDASELTDLSTRGILRVARHVGSTNELLIIWKDILSWAREPSFIV